MFGVSFYIFKHIKRVCSISNVQFKWVAHHAERRLQRQSQWWLLLLSGGHAGLTRADQLGQT
jgi:hypothetical protein